MPPPACSLWTGVRRECSTLIGVPAMSARLVALVALLLGASSTFADEAEDRAVAAVKKLGGTVIRDDKAPGRPVIGINLAFTKAKDADLKIIPPIMGLRWLNLNGTKVTGAGLKELTPLKSLQEMQLASTRLTDADLKVLTSLNQLQALNLGGTPVTDA